MKSYNELDDTGKRKALEFCVGEILRLMLGNQFTFNIKTRCGRKLQGKMENILKEAKRNGTPWFAGEALMLDNDIKEAVMRLALLDARRAYFPAEEETVIYLHMVMT